MPPRAEQRGAQQRTDAARQVDEARAREVNEATTTQPLPTVPAPTDDNRVHQADEDDGTRDVHLKPHPLGHTTAHDGASGGGKRERVDVVDAIGVSERAVRTETEVTPGLTGGAGARYTKANAPPADGTYAHIEQILGGRARGWG